MDRKDIQTSHTRKASEILLQLAENVCPADKKDAANQLNLCSVTINDYLKGRVRDLSTAEKLIVFFRKCVTRREAIFTGQPAKVA